MPRIARSEIMLLPVLRNLGDGERHTRQKSEAMFLVCSKPAIKKGGDNSARLKNWVAFALKNLQRVEAVAKIGLHAYQINQRGLDLLNQGHENITIEILKQYPEVRQSLHIAAVKAAQKRTA